MSTPPPPRRPAPRPAPTPPAAPVTPRSGSGGVLLKLLGVLLLAVGAGVAWREYRARQLPPPPAPPPRAETPPPPPVVTPDLPPPPRDTPPNPAPDTPAPVTPVVTEPPKPAALPPLPALDHPDALGALRASTLARLEDGRWEEHLAVVRSATLATLASRPRSAGAAQLDRLSEKGALPLALVQLSLLPRLLPGPDRANAPATDFFRRLITTPEWFESLAENLRPEDHLPLVVARWAELDARETSPARKEAYRNLALALALIHDKPEAGAAAAARYDHYRKLAEAKKLLIAPAKLEPDELVWAVGPGAFPLEDADWAVKHLALALGNLGDAYAKIPYRMNHAPYPEYRMEHVLALGGICMNQAQFAEGNARARGVPCAYVAGEGSRGGHAWFAFRGPRGWTNTTGRYHDGYACGMATHPQTGKPVREWDLMLFNNPARANGNRRAGLRLARAAAIVPESAEKLVLLEAAALRDPGDPQLRAAWFEALLADNRPRSPDFWLKLVADHRNDFKLHPDHFDITDRIETAKVFPGMPPDRVGEFLRNRRRQSLRQNPDRFDKLTESVRREADYYKSTGDEKRIGSLYAGALREYGDNLPAFVRLAADFDELSKDNPTVRRAGMLVLESVFNKDVDSKLKGDSFALAMQATVAGRVADLFAADGDDKKAAKYRERAQLIAAKAKELRTAMR